MITSGSDAPQILSTGTQGTRHVDHAPQCQLGATFCLSREMPGAGRLTPTGEGGCPQPEAPAEARSPGSSLGTGLVTGKAWAPVSSGLTCSCRTQRRQCSLSTPLLPHLSHGMGALAVLAASGQCEEALRKVCRLQVKRPPVPHTLTWILLCGLRWQGCWTVAKALGEVSGSGLSSTYSPENWV